MSIELMQRHLQIDGWYVIEGVIPADEVGAVRDHVLETVNANKHKRKNAPENIGAVSGLIAHDQSFAPYLVESRLLGLCKAMLGDHVRISFTSSIVNYPGNERSQLHSDWPFNQQNALHLPAPYPDVVAHLTTIWMLTPFTEENGATFIVSGSHRASNNPTGGNGVELFEPYPTERQVIGEAGSVMVFDSRLWHAAAPNRSTQPRVGMAIRYAPNWLNLEVLRPGSDERRRLVDETGASENVVPEVPRDVFDELPQAVKPLFRHWVARE